MDGVHDLDDSEALFGIKGCAPGRLDLGADAKIFNRLVVREKHRDQAGVGSALHVVLAAQRMQSGAGTADLAGDERKRNQAARVVGAVGVLGDAHAPENDRGSSARIFARDRAQRICFDPADRCHFFRREVLDVLGSAAKPSV